MVVVVPRRVAVGAPLAVSTGRHAPRVGGVRCGGNWEATLFDGGEVLRAQTPDGSVQSFLVEGDTKGLTRRPMSKFGRRIGDNAAEMVFDNVHIPAGRILPPSPKGRTDMGTHPTIAALTLVAVAIILRSHGYTHFVIALVALTVIVGIGLNILLGLAGQISLGHVGFYAIGAYTIAILTTKAGLS